MLYTQVMFSISQSLGLLVYLGHPRRLFLRIFIRILLNTVSPEMNPLLDLTLEVILMLPYSLHFLFHLAIYYAPKLSILFPFLPL